MFSKYVILIVHPFYRKYKFLIRKLNISLVIICALRLVLAILTTLGLDFIKIMMKLLTTFIIGQNIKQIKIKFQWHGIIINQTQLSMIHFYNVFKINNKKYRKMNNNYNIRVCMMSPRKN